MQIKAFPEREMTKYFINNEYVGYRTTEGSVYCFNEHDYAELVGERVPLNNVRSIIKTYYMDRVIEKSIESRKNERKNEVSDETAMLGFLACKLALYEPNSPIVLKALEELEKKA
ncbi:MAG: hypothetical protein CMC15_18665 [Flavobacteriaceae bacterium]|nr:hypothetical protein [Flavobacteriaceae bacterium]